MSIAVASALADAIARSAADRPNDVPLWPLVICGAIFVVGVLLFAFHITDEPRPTVAGGEPQSAVAKSESTPPVAEVAKPEPAPPVAEVAKSEPASPVAEVGQEIDIAGFFVGNTDIQAQKILKGLLGQRVEAHGKLGNVGEWSYGRALVTFMGATPPTIVMTFSDQKVVDESLTFLRRGTEISVTGTISTIERWLVALDDCKITSIGLPQETRSYNELT
jgi:hypothetical protein